MLVSFSRSFSTFTWLEFLCKLHSLLVSSRRYPTVEKRAKGFNKSSYAAIPEDEDLVKAILRELGLTDDNKTFVEYRDNCSRICKTNVHSLTVPEGKLWPVLAIPDGDFIYVCLPLVEQLLTPTPPLISINSISEAFAFLYGMMQFINSKHGGDADISSKLTQLPLLVTRACPLGSPVDTNLSALPDSLSNMSTNQSYKSPAWATSKQKGKAQIEVFITEKVDSTQYDKGDDSDTWQVYGTVSCKVSVLLFISIVPTISGRFVTHMRVNLDGRQLTYQHVFAVW